MNLKPRPQKEILVPFRGVSENFRRALPSFSKGSTPGVKSLLDIEGFSADALLSPYSNSPTLILGAGEGEGGGEIW